MLGLLVLIFIGKSILFKQERSGKIDRKTGKERIFTLYKFRSMTNEKDDNGDLLPDEDRLTKFGRFLRKTSLDELPELFNILLGDMSFVGPRPWVVEYSSYFNDFESKRQFVRPVLTGLSQINGRNLTSRKKRFEFDAYYVDNLSLFMDIRIIVLTVIKVFTQEGVEFIEGQQKNHGILWKSTKKINKNFTYYIKLRL